MSNGLILVGLVLALSIPASCVGKSGSNLNMLPPEGGPSAAIFTSQGIKVPTIYRGCSTGMQKKFPERKVVQGFFKRIDGSKLPLTAMGLYHSPTPNVNGSVGFVSEEARGNPLIPDGSRCVEVSTVVRFADFLSHDRQNIRLLRIPLNPILEPGGASTPASSEAADLAIQQPAAPMKILLDGFAQFRVTEVLMREVTTEELAKAFSLSRSTKAAAQKMLKEAGYCIDSNKKTWKALQVQGYFSRPRIGKRLPTVPGDGEQVRYETEMLSPQATVKMLQNNPVFVAIDDRILSMDVNALNWEPKNFVGFANFKEVTALNQNPKGPIFQMLLPFDPFAPVHQ